MRIKNEQLEAFAQLKQDTVRRSIASEIESQGFVVTEDSSTGEVTAVDQAGGEAKLRIEPRTLTVTSGEGRQTRYRFDSQGELGAIRDSAGNLTEVRTTKSDGEAEYTIQHNQRTLYALSHDEYGQLTKLVRPGGATTTFDYHAGRCTRVTGADGKALLFEYDDVGRVTSFTDKNGNQTALQYSDFDYPEAVRFPNGDRQQFRFLDSGRLESVTHNGRPFAQFSHGQDDVTVAYEDGTAAYLRTEAGQIVEAHNGSVELKFEYDDKGNLTKESVNGREVTYERDSVGALVGVVTPDGERIVFERDRESRVKRVLDWDGNAYQIGYDPSGSIAEIISPNGVRQCVETTDLGAPRRWRLSQGEDRAFLQFSWGYDASHRLTSEVCTGLHPETCEYQYDDAGRLQAVTQDGVASTTVLDGNGNRVEVDGVVHRFNGRDQLRQVGARIHQYDERGNLIEGYVAGRPATFRFNARNQLVALETNGVVTRYAYDPIGRRIRKEHEGVITEYVWAGAQLLSETTTGDGTTTRTDYLFLAGQPTPLALRTDGVSYSLHAGRRAEPLCATDPSGRVVWQARYGAWGEITVSVNDIRQPLRLAGQYQDDESLLYYSAARYYDPRLGRYLSVDPLGPHGGSLNYYLYCDGDPLNRLDPTGELAFLAAIAVAAVAGAVIGAAIGAGVEAYSQFQEHGQLNSLGDVGKAALLGGAIGLVGGAVGGAVGAALPAVTMAGLAGAGAVSGVVSAAAEECAEAALTGEDVNTGDLLSSMALGGVIGAVTGPVGGLIARRMVKGGSQAAARQAAREGSEEIAEAGARRGSEEAIGEGAERAGKEAGEQASERTAKSAADRLDELALDPAHGKATPGSIREAQVGMDLEAEGLLKGPITREPTGAAEFVDAEGVHWDVKSFDSRFPARKGGFKLERDLQKIRDEIAQGEKVILNTDNLNATDLKALRDAIQNDGLADHVLWHPPSLNGN